MTKKELIEALKDFSDDTLIFKSYHYYDSHWKFNVEEITDVDKRIVNGKVVVELS